MIHQHAVAEQLNDVTPARKVSGVEAPPNRAAQRGHIRREISESDLLALVTLHLALLLPENAHPFLQARATGFKFVQGEHLGRKGFHQALDLSLRLTAGLPRIEF